MEFDIEEYSPTEAAVDSLLLETSEQTGLIPCSRHCGGTNRCKQYVFKQGKFEYVIKKILPFCAMNQTFQWVVCY